VLGDTGLNLPGEGKREPSPLTTYFERGGKKIQPTIGDDITACKEERLWGKKGNLSPPLREGSSLLWHSIFHFLRRGKKPLLHSFLSLRERGGRSPGPPFTQGVWHKINE